MSKTLGLFYKIIIFLQILVPWKISLFPLLRAEINVGAIKKSSSLIGRAIKREGGGRVKGRAIKEKNQFFVTFFSNVPTAIKLEGGGG